MLKTGPDEANRAEETELMSDLDGAPSGPMINRPERSGNIGLLIGLALVLAGAAAAFAVMDRAVAQPFILALLGILAVVGVFCLFAGAIGFLRLSARPGESNPLASSMALAKPYKLT